MAQKPLYIVVAVVGIAAASGGAWWYQNRPVDASAGAAVAASQTGSQSAGSGGGAGGASAAGTAAAPASGGASGPRAAGVEVAKVETMRLVDDTQAVGALRSRQSVMVRPEVSGRVARINFRDGERVQKGQLMVQFDDQLPRAQVAQAEAELSIARANHKRNQELVAQNFIAQRSLDESLANLQVAQAQLSLGCARWQRMKILAPYAGTLGIRTVNIGDYVKEGADLVNLEDLSALYVDFRLPERYQDKVALRQTVDVQVDAIPGHSFQARIEAIDPLIDATGRAISVRAMLVNSSGTGKARAADKAAPAVPQAKDAASLRSDTVATQTAEAVCPAPRLPSASGGVATGPLRPGMFARVNALFALKQAALSIPEEAIVPMGGKQFVIKAVPPDAVPEHGPLPPDTKLVSQRTEVKLGARRPGRVEILSGLTATDTVVVAGQFRLQKDGTALRVIETRN